MYRLISNHRLRSFGYASTDLCLLWSLNNNMPISKASLKTSWRILLKMFLDFLVLIALADISIAILWDAFYWLICKNYFFSFAKENAYLPISKFTYKTALDVCVRSRIVLVLS